MAAPAASPVARTSHLSLRVADLARSRKFYADAMGLCEIGRDGAGRVFMASSPGEAEPLLVLEQARDGSAPKPMLEPDPFVGMEHFAFELEPDDFATLRAAYRRLKAAGAVIHHTVDHIVTNSIYFLDPDRNLIEVYINCPRERYRGMDHPYGSLRALDEDLESDGETA